MRILAQRPPGRRQLAVRVKRLELANQLLADAIAELRQATGLAAKPALHAVKDGAS